MSEKVVDKVKKRIAELEQAVQRLDFVKRHLNQNSSEIKTQIHTAITSHLECLRQREVCLLGQVDGVLVDKEEVLQRQQARLNKALGILHSSLNTAITQATSARSQASSSSMDSSSQQSGSEELDTAATHLLQALEELNSMELKAEETPYIAFRADQLALRESILSYGRVDANGMPLLLAFADDHRPSASLPKHLEEYEDSQHHLFYKTLQDGTANNSSIRVTMPKLSSRVEDWLQRPMLQLTTSGADISVKSPASESTAGTPMSQSTCAIQNWLSEIKHNPDLEDDDDFEIVDHSTSSPRESPVEEEECEGEGCDPLAHIPRDSQLWLLKGGSATSSVTTQDELRAFFSHIPKDSSMWLMTASKQLERLAAAKNSVGGEGGWFSHIPTTTSTWLKTRGAQHKAATTTNATTTTTTTTVPDMFQHIPRDHHLWLHSHNKKKEEEEKMEQMEGEEIEEACDNSASSMPAMIQYPNDSLSMDSWLLRHKVQGSDLQKAALSELPGIQRYLRPAVNPGSWLARADEKHDEQGPFNPFNPNLKFNPFSHISSNLSDWLHSGGKGSGTPSEKISSTQQWLRPSEPSEGSGGAKTISSPLDSLLASFSQLGTQHWLLHDPQGAPEVSEGSDRSWTVLPDSPQSSVLSLPLSTPHLPLLQPSPWAFEHSAQ